MFTAISSNDIVVASVLAAEPPLAALKFCTSLSVSSTKD
jgi:hypothetical protein